MPLVQSILEKTMLRMGQEFSNQQDDAYVYEKLPPVEGLDSAMGTEKWEARNREPLDLLKDVNREFKRMRGKKVVNGEGSKPARKTAKGIEQ